MAVAINNERPSYDIANIISLRSHRMGDQYIKKYLRQSHKCRTIVARIIGHIHAAFPRHSHDVRPIKLRTFITIDRLTTFSRTSCDCCVKVVRESHDGFARNDKSRKINILVSIETSDWEGTTLLERNRGLEGARLLEGVTLLGGVGLLNGSKY